jgi:hypothetical protein
MKLFKFGVYQDAGVFWFRFFGYGLHFVKAKNHKPLFTERCGFVKKYRVGPWLVEFLKPLDL